MNSEQVAQDARRIAASLHEIGREDSAEFSALYSQACEFIKRFGGRDSEFLVNLKDQDRMFSDLAARETAAILNSFAEFVEAGLLTALSPERQAQLDVVSDFLEQADHFLSDSSLHPGCAAYLIGATLEEFLRNWVEAENLAIVGRVSIDAYVKALRGKNLLSKQDVKDITSWAGLRNAAAHGLWDDVSDRHRVWLMLESVNLFIRRHTP